MGRRYMGPSGRKREQSAPQYAEIAFCVGLMGAEVIIAEDLVRSMRAAQPATPFLRCQIVILFYQKSDVRSKVQAWKPMDRLQTYGA